MSVLGLPGRDSVLDFGDLNLANSGGFPVESVGYPITKLILSFGPRRSADPRGSLRRRPPDSIHQTSLENRDVPISFEKYLVGSRS